MMGLPSSKDAEYMVEINRLEGELEHYKTKSEELLGQLREQTRSFCTHCGRLFPPGRLGLAAFRVHIAECNNHPLHHLAVENRRLRAECNVLRCQLEQIASGKVCNVELYALAGLSRADEAAEAAGGE